ncbi:MAG: type I DNA topoisomerase [Deltaproteobacteria bacterium]|nr:type I DNA topoisomerase [Deltaproteobacteria bacterium]
MSRSLIIVESPAKAKTIQKYLGSGYQVLASKGHIRDLPRSGLQVDTAHDYAPHYEVLEDHKTVVTELRKAAKEAETIYLAPDPDREGEAIAWHIAHELRSLKKPMQRVEFHEITKKGVQAGLAAPRTVDEARFQAQQARRILDRLIGYELSPVLWKRLCRRVNGHYLSAGRVQSAALRLIVDREDDIKGFVQQEYWPVAATLLGGRRPAFTAALVEIDGVKVVTPTRDRAPRPTERVLGAQGDAESARDDLRAAAYKVAAVEKKERRRRAPPPYITSSLQRDASGRLGFSASRTMQVAQRLYEGIDVGAEGPVGLITYMRTDSTRLSADAVEAARAYISKRFGKASVPDRPNAFKTRASAQDAHEAIRPTSLDHCPEDIKKHLKPDEFKVYKLIWERFLACQMADAVYDQTTATVEARGRQRYVLRASGNVLKAPGWLEAQGVTAEVEVAGEEAVREEGRGAEDEAPRTLPELSVGEALSVTDPPGVTCEQKFTQPAARYNEGTLVKALEDLGIGRPSTYAEIVTKVLSRDYVEKRDRQLVPTKLGTAKTHGLRASFPDVVDYEFTARIEEELDKVEESRADWVKLVDRIYKPFKRLVDKEMKGKDPGEAWPRPEPSDRVCDKCGSPMQRRWGPNNDYYACTAYPTCKNIVDESPPRPTLVYEGRKCPKCGRALLIKARRGSDETFLSCSGWKRKDPDCDYTAPMPTGITCPKCGGDVVKIGTAKGRRPFWGCANYNVETVKCDFKVYQAPVKEPCPTCGSTFLVRAGGKTRPVLKCVKDRCDYQREVESEPDPEAPGLEASAD